MDHRRGDPGAVAAVFLVDVLDHFLAPLMLEIDVDVGRLLALLAEMNRSNSRSLVAGSTAVIPRQ